MQVRRRLWCGSGWRYRPIQLRVMRPQHALVCDVIDIEFVDLDEVATKRNACGERKIHRDSGLEKWIGAVRRSIT